MDTTTFATLRSATNSSAAISNAGTIDLLTLSRSELADDLVQTFGFKPYRAQQIFPWLYKRRVTDFSSMTDIAKEARDKLAERYSISRPKVVTRLISKDGSQKYLLGLSTGEQVESVLIKQPKRWTLCISSQVGCAIGCKFCRTASMGLKRNLSSAEIVGQVLAVQDDIAALQASGMANPPQYFSNIVFMGMGEPLHNLDNLVKALRILNDQLGPDFSARRITVSTSGLVPRIVKFGESGVHANLAISLNATTNEVRDVIMPINKRYPLEALLGALKNYPLPKSRRITFEYVLLRDVNDTDADLKRLPELLKGIPAKVNLIPYNANPALPFKAPTEKTIYKWQETLLSKKVCSSIRWSKGQDISGACGQLATEHEKGNAA